MPKTGSTAPSASESISSLTVKQWVEEYRRLKALNEQILGTLQRGRTPKWNPQKLRRLRAISTRRGVIAAVAMDQRRSLRRHARRRRGNRPTRASPTRNLPSSNPP